MHVYMVTLMYIVATLFAALFPHPHMNVCEKDAIERGWSKWIIVLTRSTQYFTLFGQLLVFLAAFFPFLIHTSLVIECMVFILYHGLVQLDVTHLTYNDHAIAKEITSFFPPRSILAIPWIGMHLQHTYSPWVAYSQLSAYNERGDLEDIIHMTGWTFLFYVAWNSFCWHVQGMPAYPIQQRVYDSGYYLDAIACLSSLVVLLSMMVV